MEASMDLTKLKVLDLKKELKIRGLATTGKRTELLERLQAAHAAGVGLAEDDGEEEYDEDEILAGDDADDDDSKMTPSEEAAALAAAAKATATPRGRRSVAVAAPTPRTGQKKLALRRTISPSLVVPTDTPSVVVAATAPITPVVATKIAVAKQATPKKLTTAVKTVASAASGNEPAKKVIKLSKDTSNKENGCDDAAAADDDDDDDDEDDDDATTPAVPKTASEIRAERFGITSEALKKQQRSDRFGSSANAKLSMTPTPVDVETLKSRAARFGETTAKTLTQSESDDKKKKRNERFGIAEKKDLSSDDAKDKRATRFAAVEVSSTTKDDTPSKPTLSASGKTLIMVEGSEIKIKRAAKFAL